MAGGVNNLANLPLKTDSNGYLLVTIGGGNWTPDKITLDSVNLDVVLRRSATKTLAIDTDGALGPLTLLDVRASLIDLGKVNGAVVSLSGAGILAYNTRAHIGSPGDAQLTLLNAAESAGAALDFATDGTLKVRGRALTAGTGNLDVGAKVTAYNAITTAGQGVPSIYGAGTVSAQTTAAASIATYTTPNAIGDYVVSGNVNVTTSTTHSFSLNVNYTDEGGTARVLVLPVAQLAGGFAASGLITNATGAGPYEAAAMHIRCKATTAITIQTPASGTFTSVVYNAAGVIRQVQ